MKHKQHHQPKPVPDEKVLPHIGDARPEFVAILKELKSVSVNPDDVRQVTEQFKAGDVLQIAREHATALGYTEGDIKLLCDALYASSDRLKGTSIGLKSGGFMARFLKSMENHLGVSLAKKSPLPQKVSKPEPVDVNILSREVVALRKEVRDFHQTLGFVPWDQRALIMCPDEELPKIMTAFERQLTANGLAYDFNWAARALWDSLMMNPQVRVKDGKIACKQELKPPFVETLTKSMIARVKGLHYEQRQQVAEILSDGVLYADGVPADVSKVFPKLEVHGGLLGERPGNYWRPDNPAIHELGKGGREKVLTANQDLTEAILTRLIKARPGECRFLEIGPGRGDFYGWIPPEFRQDFQHLEWNQHLIDEFKRKHPEAKVIQGNAYELGKHVKQPLDGVFGLTAFSSFWNLDHLVDQVWNNLRPGGFFVSMHDIVPNDQQVGDELRRRGMYGPDTNHFWFRDQATCDIVLTTLGSLMNPKVRREEARKARVSDDSDSGFMLKQFGAHPDFGGYESTWKQAAELLHRHAAIENMSEFFYKWLEIELEFRGFRFLSPPGPKHSVAVLNREKRHDSGAIQIDGYPEGPHDFRAYWPVEHYPGLTNFVRHYGQNNVIESSMLWVTVAQKPVNAV